MFNGSFKRNLTMQITKVTQTGHLTRQLLHDNVNKLIFKIQLKQVTEHVALKGNLQLQFMKVTKQCNFKLTMTNKVT